MLQRTNITTNECYNKRMLQQTNATTNKCYNERCYNERCYNELMLQRTMLQRTNATTNECYNKRMLQRANVTTNDATTYDGPTNDATTNKCYDELFLSIKSGCYNEHRCYNETRRNTIGRCTTCMRMTCWAFLLWLERHSSSLISFVRLSYQFNSVICLFAPCLCFSNLPVQCIKVKQINCLLFWHLYFLFCVIFFLFKWLCWMVTLL